MHQGTSHKLNDLHIYTFFDIKIQFGYFKANCPIYMFHRYLEAEVLFIFLHFFPLPRANPVTGEYSKDRANLQCDRMSSAQWVRANR